jgi:cysteinyl-tRNA synthetase
VIAALDDDLDLAKVVAMLGELETAQGIAPGAKFEAFTHTDRVLAVDLMRTLRRAAH